MTWKCLDVDEPTTHVGEDGAITEPVSNTPVDIVKAARRWIRAKQGLSELRVSLARGCGCGRPFEEKFLPLIGELDRQQARIDSVLVALQEKAATLSEEDCQETVSTFETLTGLVNRRARVFHEEVEACRDQLELEESKRIKVFEWLDRFSRRTWAWLRKTDKVVTTLERKVFFP